MGCGAKDVRMSNIIGSSRQRRKCVRMQKVEVQECLKPNKTEDTTGNVRMMKD